MKTVVFIMATGQHPYYELAKRAIDRYYEYLGIKVHYQTTMPNGLENLNYCWGRYYAHRIVDADVIISQDMDILPVSFDHDIREEIDQTTISMALDPAAEHINTLSPRYKNFRYNAGMMIIPRSMQPHMENCVKEYANPGNLMTTWDSPGDQYSINDYLATYNVNVNEIDNKYDMFWHPGLDYSKAAFVHYSGHVPGGGHKHEYICKYHPREMIA